MAACGISFPVFLIKQSIATESNAVVSLKSQFINSTNLKNEH